MSVALKVEHSEAIFIRFLHLLAHHPDFSVLHEQLLDMAKCVYLTDHFYAFTYGDEIRYVDFYLDLVATADNISLLYHLAMKTKTVRDAESHTYSEVSR